MRHFICKNRGTLEGIEAPHSLAYCTNCEGKLTELVEAQAGSEAVSAEFALLGRNLNHLMALHAPEMTGQPALDDAKKAIEDAGGMLAFLCDCKDIVKKAV